MDHTNYFTWEIFLRQEELITCDFRLHPGICGGCRGRLSMKKITRPTGSWGLTASRRVSNRQRKNRHHTADRQEEPGQHFAMRPLVLISGSPSCVSWLPWRPFITPCGSTTGRGSSDIASSYTATKTGFRHSILDSHPSLETPISS